ncbi:hypothetical protein MMAD_21740 [Mycolicibacterium madagascariense]|uniref:Uncharacterized protein n=2 Tax=Mycolicibacterium madagascariense TaxID=212765 RepID=A0A7I7XFB2_9MYCO|nr:hypothetical protein MMAD_21740 [Mycolicibacterium madagascariense]
MLRVPGWIMWLYRRKFVRDVASQTVAGFIVVIAGYLFGLGAGTIPPPTNRNFVVDLLIVVASFVVASAVTFWLALRLDLNGPTTHRPLVVPSGGDVFRAYFWQAKPWWIKTGYVVARWLVLTMPLWGTAALSAALWLAFSP